MGIQDRDYMRDDWHRRPNRVARLGFLVLAGVLAVVVLSTQAPTPQTLPAPIAEIPSGGFASERSAGPIDVNTATLEELDDLPYVWTRVATEIVAGRPYDRPEDLLRVRGIGPKILDRLRPRITFGSAEAPARRRD